MTDAKTVRVKRVWDAAQKAYSWVVQARLIHRQTRRGQWFDVAAFSTEGEAHDFVKEATAKKAEAEEVEA